MKHTPEPWEFKDTEMKITGAGDWFGLQVIANVSPKMSFTKGMGTQCANAARIVACVNACAGMDDPAGEIERLRAEREQLLAALEDFVTDYHLWQSGQENSPETVYHIAKEAIAKVKQTNP
jgi:hypothetical protein